MEVIFAPELTRRLILVAAALPGPLSAGPRRGVPAAQHARARPGGGRPAAAAAGRADTAIGGRGGSGVWVAGTPRATNGHKARRLAGAPPLLADGISQRQPLPWRCRPRGSATRCRPAQVRAAALTCLVEVANWAGPELRAAELLPLIRRHMQASDGGVHVRVHKLKHLGEGGKGDKGGREKQGLRKQARALALKEGRPAHSGGGTTCCNICYIPAASHTAAQANEPTPHPRRPRCCPPLSPPLPCARQPLELEISVQRTLATLFPSIVAAVRGHPLLPLVQGLLAVVVEALPGPPEPRSLMACRHRNRSGPRLPRAWRRRAILQLLPPPCGATGRGAAARVRRAAAAADAHAAAGGDARLLPRHPQ
jgi:hypothetical protein